MLPWGNMMPAAFSVGLGCTGRPGQAIARPPRVSLLHKIRSHRLTAGAYRLGRRASARGPIGPRVTSHPHAPIPPFSDRPRRSTRRPGCCAVDGDIGSTQSAQRRSASQRQIPARVRSLRSSASLRALRLRRHGNEEEEVKHGEHRAFHRDPLSGVSVISVSSVFEKEDRTNHCRTHRPLIADH
jgi:hypothetical protein